jgi:hypothetical protein
MRNLFKPFNPFPPKPKPQAPTQPPPDPSDSPADLPEVFGPGRTVKPDEVRALAELIRKRYELDVEIWGLRDSQARDWPKIKDKMRRSDATLLKIRRTIQSWDRRDIFESDSDWHKFKEIQWRLMAGGKRDWAQNPPWKDKDM